MGPESELYKSGQYLEYNPSWNEEETPWKAAKIIDCLQKYNIIPQSLCEIGCGSGGILGRLRDNFGPYPLLSGFDIASGLENFWEKYRDKNINFFHEDFLDNDFTKIYDVILLIDIIEHLENPFDFLKKIKNRGNYFVCHIPLDLNALGAIRDLPLWNMERVGHLHFWNKELALAFMQRCGYEIVHWEYTRGAVELPTARLKKKLARWPRRLLFFLAPDLAGKILGGFSLLVLAR